MAMCRLSLVSTGIQTAFPLYSPSMVPSAFSMGLISSISFISLSVIQDAEPYNPDLLVVKPLGS